ncbi:MAG TPA: acyl-CoA reductase [Bacteroidales bacterium]|nr:acyl-CoA reductase [Bacteroidales bacterium]
MTLKERIAAFSELGKVLRDALDGEENMCTAELDKLINSQYLVNPWFTPSNVRYAVSAIADELTEENLFRWTDAYQALKNEPGGRNVGIVMAGNIPLAGFHDFLTVLVTGNNVIAKTSSKDKDLIMFTATTLCSINGEFSKRISFTDGLMKGFDSIIATGSDNSSRYFEYYFGKYPHIIRKNRNGIAIIDGSETESELAALGHDIFSYFGLGCRNVSKIYLPEGYNTDKLAAAWKEYERIIDHNKYANNYDYNKAVYMVNRESFKDIGFLLLLENHAISSPVAVLYYEFYSDINKLRAEIDNHNDKIQCIAGKNDIPFGMSQRPHLWDYADGIDTVEFLLKKN